MIDLYMDCDIDPVSLREITSVYERYITEELPIIIEADTSVVKVRAKDKIIEIKLIENSVAKTAKLAIYLLLVELTGISLPWGNLTGVKPLKKMQELYEKNFSSDEAAAFFRDTYDVSNEKISLMLETARNQRQLLYAPENTAGLYIHIPLCISKCTYCSFPSMITKIGSSLCDDYLFALCYELDAIEDYIEKRGITTDSVYIGGGTPSIFSIRQIQTLMNKVYRIADQCREITFEAGRCDTLTYDKLKCLNDCAVTRISLNPQTTNNATLMKINRGALYENFLLCYDDALKAGHDEINCDLILGLEGENEDDYAKSLSDVCSLHPSNITLHTLCSKRASELEAKDVFANHADVSAFHDKARGILKEKGYFPYYLYKQKNALTGAENVGYSLKDKECIYNIRMMGEKQMILSAGAGSSTKIINAQKDRYENVYNVKELSLYIKNIEQIIEKKFNAIENIEKSFK